MSKMPEFILQPCLGLREGCAVDVISSRQAAEFMFHLPGHEISSDVQPLGTSCSFLCFLNH